MKTLSVIPVLLAIFLPPVTASAFANTDDAHARTSKHLIHSSILEETREVIVRLPPRYDSSQKYPVVYVLDGEWGFEFVASYLDYMSDNEIYPDLIVTAVRNVNRNRDYVPRADSNHPHTGGADYFLTFVEEEWVKFIENKFPTDDRRILLGHSFGGVFTLHTFLTKPGLFDANIALSASAWVGNRILFEEATALFSRPTVPETFVYMAVGEGDGGPTLPSSKDLADLFREQAPETVDWTFSITPQTDHFKNFPSGTHAAFMALFPAWGFAAELRASGEQRGAVGVKTWFAEKQMNLRWRFKPAWFDLSNVAYGLVASDSVEAGLAVMEELRNHYPDSAQVAWFSGSVFLRAGLLNEAEEQTRRAILIAKEDGLDPNTIQIDGLENLLSDIQKSRQDKPR